MAAWLLATVVTPRLQALAQQADVPPLVRPSEVESAEQPAEAGKTLAGSPAPRTIEEIVVTAQKREESIREVPISLSVLDADFVNREGIVDFREASRFVPNTRVGGSGVWIFPNIRGFNANSVNKAFEQLVGLTIDDVSYGRVQYFDTGLFDLERIEVLRGPQGTLFGNNATAGVFNLTTRDPTDEWTGFVDAEYGTDDYRRLEAAAGGPLVKDVLNFRVAAVSDERDGVFENTTARVVAGAPDDLGARDRKGVRVKLGFPDLVGAKLVLGYELFDTEIVGTGGELREVPTENARAFFREFDPEVSFDPYDFRTATDHPDFSTRQVQKFTAKGRSDVAGWAVDAVAGYSVLEVTDEQESDLSPAPLIRADSTDHNPQTTVEIRLSSPELPGFFGVDGPRGVSLGNTELVTGFFFQNREISDSQFELFLNDAVAGAFRAFQNAPPGATPSLPPGFGRSGPTAFEESTNNFFEQSQDVIAGFGQMQWHVLPRWTLTYGMRLQHESKEATWNRVNSDPAPLFTAIGFEEFTADLDRSEFQFAPKVSIQYDWSDEITTFASWVKGFRPGGFNEFALVGDPAALTFKSEDVTSWEVGAKTSLFDDTMTLNVGLFNMVLTNFQVLTGIPTPQGLNLIAVVNAGEARARGVEADLTWLTTDWLTTQASVGFNDSEFLEFPFGSCLDDRMDRDGDGDARCDLSGEPLERAPKWVATVMADVRQPLAAIPAIGKALPVPVAGADLLGGFTLEYVDTHFFSQEIDPRLRNPSIVRVDTAIGIGHSDQGWQVRLRAQNVTDEAIAMFGLDVPVSAGNIWQVPEPQPRQILGELRWQF